MELDAEMEHRLLIDLCDRSAQHAELAGVDVGNVSAPALVRGLGVESEIVREEMGGKFILTYCEEGIKISPA